MRVRKKDLHETKETLTSLQIYYATYQIFTILGIIFNVLMWLRATGYFVLVFILSSIFLAVAVAYEAGTHVLHYLCAYSGHIGYTTKM